MILFEDKQDDILSRFFQSAYPKEITEKFVYSNGNGNLCNKAEMLLKTTDEDIIVFLDSVPDNGNIVDVYHSLKKLSSRYDYRLLVMNIVCAEFYFIKAFSKDIICISDVGIDTVLNKEVWFDSELICSNRDREFVKNFEKFCKLILIKNFRDCAKHSRMLENDKLNEQYDYFYSLDCLCDKAISECIKRAKCMKVSKLLKEYPCLPRGSNIVERGEITKKELVELHMKLVDEFNSMVDKYNEYNAKYNMQRKYKKIPYMKMK